MVPACGSYGAHIGGISRLMLSRGPAYYANGTSHRIFIGCRPSQVSFYTPILYRLGIKLIFPTDYMFYIIPQGVFSGGS